MHSRADRHDEIKPQTRRTQKNQELYDDLKNNTNYNEVNIIEPVIEKDNFSLEEITSEPKRPLQKQKSIYSDKIHSSLMGFENKEYDINKVLKDAKKTRTEKDELEAKRNLKKKEYNIVNEIDIEKIDEIKEERKNSGIKTNEEEDVKDLINTIYRNKLREEIDEVVKCIEEDNGDLFDELLPKTTEETIIDENLSKEIVQMEKSKKEKEKLSNSFFTKSIEIYEEDLEDNNDEEYEEMDESFLDDDKNLPLYLKIIITVITLVVLVVVIYFVCMRI